MKKAFLSFQSLAHYLSTWLCQGIFVLMQNEIYSTSCKPSCPCFSYKRLFAEMNSKVRHIWKSSHTANVTRTPRLFGNLVDHHTLVQVCAFLGYLWIALGNFTQTILVRIYNWWNVLSTHFFKCFNGDFPFI